MSGWDLSPLETCSRDTTARDSTIQDTPPSRPLEGQAVRPVAECRLLGVPLSIATGQWPNSVEWPPYAPLSLPHPTQSGSDEFRLRPRISFAVVPILLGKAAFQF